MLLLILLLFIYCVYVVLFYLKCLDVLILINYSGCLLRDGLKTWSLNPNLPVRES